MAGLLMGVSWADGQPITVSSEVGELLGDNMLDLQPARRWRSDGLGIQNVESVFEFEYPVNMVVLAGNNLTTATIVHIKLVDDGNNIVYEASNTGGFHELGWGVQPLGEFGLGGYYITADRDPAGYHDTDYIVFTFDTVNARKLIIDIDDTSNPDGYLEIGRLKVGRALEVDFSAGYEMGWRDTSSLTRTRGGALRSDNGRSYRYVNVNTVLKDNQTELTQIFRHTALRTDVVWSGFPPASTNEGRENLILGRLTSYTGSNWTNEGVTTSFSIEEAI
jgi:hypothetical protein